MEYLRQTINSDSLASVFNLPASLRNREVDVIILPANGNKAKPQKYQSAKGCLGKYANPSLISQEQGVWAKAVEEQHADS